MASFGIRQLCVLMPVALAQLGVPASARGQSVTTSLNISADVANSCSFDSSDSALLSVTCAVQTPIAASSTNTTTPIGTAAGTASGALDAAASPVSFSPASGVASDASTAKKSTVKVCNFLATAEMENDSFNQFVSDIHQHAAPQSYYSTYQVCF